VKTISIINLKGGVGKTVSAINIAHILTTYNTSKRHTSNPQVKVLLVDNDKQGNTSEFFGFGGGNWFGLPGMSEVMTGDFTQDDDISHLIQKTRYPNLDIVTANMSLLDADKQVLMDTDRPQHNRLKNFLNIVSSDYNYCIIDCAPDISMGVINALVASDDVLIPVKVDKFAFEGVKQIYEQIENVQKSFNPRLKLTGCFFTMVTNNNVNKQGENWLREQANYPIMKTKIRKTVKVDESTFAGIPLVEYSKKCLAAINYQDLVFEYLSNEINMSESDTKERVSV